MPFISKDWRSPGELWIKTDEGWERKKIIDRRTRELKSQQSSEDESEDTPQPHCHIIIKCTKEITGFNELNEAVKRLDFRNAVRDVRRFNYICALLELLVGQQMTNLSGCAQKALLAMMEELACYAVNNQYNPRALFNLLAKLRDLSETERSAFWGGPLGSQLLWNQHEATIDRIIQMAQGMQIKEPHPNTNPQLLHLPEECLREIILRLSDHKDLDASSKACDRLAALVDEQRVWQELANFHFTAQQIDMVTSKSDGIDWKKTYYTLKKTFTPREDRQYAEMLSLCRYCCCLFWRSLGHPCIADQCPEFRERLQRSGGALPPSPIPPSAFLKFFSL